MVRMELRRILTFMIPYKAVKKTDSHPMRWAGRGGAWWEKGRGSRRKETVAEEGKSVGVSCWA